MKASKQSLIFIFLPLGYTAIDEKTLSLNAKHYNGKDAEILYIPNYELT